MARMKFFPVDTVSHHEQASHSSALIPYSYYASLMPEHFLSVPVHWHEEFELNYIRAGQGLYRCGDCQGSVQAGDILLCLPNELHGMERAGIASLAYDTLVFHPDFLGAALPDRPAVELLRPMRQGQAVHSLVIGKAHPAYHSLQAAVEAIFTTVWENSPLGDLLLKSQLLLLLGLLTRHGDIRVGSSGKPQVSPIQPALDYIAGHFAEPITIAELAQLCGFSESHFMAQFKRRLGVSALEYICQLRIDRARTELLTTDRRVSEIAFSCGFSNLSNFNRQFLRWVGQTPSAYRMRMQNAESSNHIYQR